VIRLSIRARLTAGYAALLMAAMLTVAGGAWRLFATSMRQAADASLAERIDGTRRFIDATQHELPPEEVQDEFQEFSNLTRGETLLEVSDDTGRVLCRPELKGWDASQVPASAPFVVETSFGGQPYRALSTSLSSGGHLFRVTAAIPMGTAYAALRRFGWLLAALVPVVMLIAIAGGYWLSGRALAPVDRMTRDVQLISVSDPGRRLDVPPAGDELSRLAETFNAMLVRWQGAFADMVRFTADASHELRTPISLTRTTAELALTRPRTPDEYRTALAEIHAHSERMSALVEDLLTLARADAGVELPALSVLDVREVAADVAREVRPQAARRSLDLQVSLAGRPLLVCGGRESLRRLLLILLDNAVKYTPSGGSIRLDVSVRPAGEDGRPFACIRVTDSGPGISAADRAHVFDRFYRGSHAREAAPDGSGLGLSIAKTIAARHGGDITVFEPSGDGGCGLDVTLPLTASGSGTSESEAPDESASSDRRSA
jgi:signal transduction histidine kinase